MKYHQLSRADYEGNNYEYAGVSGLGQLPTNPLIALQTGSEEINGLAHVPTAAKPAVKAALEQLVFSKTVSPEIGGESGTAAYILGQPGSAWVSELVGKGYVVMIDRQTVPSGNIDVLATDQPASVALFAGRPNVVGGAEWVVVDADPYALSAAEAVAAGKTPPPPPGGGVVPGLPTIPGGTTTCPAGQINVAGQCLSTPPCPAGTQEVYGVCFPQLTTPPTTTPPTTVPPSQQPPGEPPTQVAKAGAGKYLLYGAGALAVVAVGAALFSRKKGSKSSGQQMAANRRNAYPREWR